MNKIFIFITLILSQPFISGCGNVASAAENEYLNIANVDSTVLIAFAVCIGCFVVCMLMMYRINRKYAKLQVTESQTAYINTNDVLPPKFLKNEWKKLREKVDALEQQLDEIRKELNSANIGQASVSRILINQDKELNNLDSSNRNLQRNEKQRKQLQKGRPQLDSDYTYLKVVDGGRLAGAQYPDNAYYRAWKYDGKLYFEFSTSKMGKAINNRTSIIEPFCEILGDSCKSDCATSVETKAEGVLNDDYTINKKVTIQYL